MPELNESHDSTLTSWIDSANEAEADFPVQNLPLGVYTDPKTGVGKVGIAIGDEILDVTAARAKGVIGGAADDAAGACAGDTLNELMALGGRHWSALRATASRALRATTPRKAKPPQAVADEILLAQADVAMRLPARIDYTDFYSSIFHATNVGKMLRPDNPLMPNYKHIPIAYHGRASSIVASGETVKRPVGQTKAPDADHPSFGPSMAFDYETEIDFSSGQVTRWANPFRCLKPKTTFSGYASLTTGQLGYPGLGISAARAVSRQELCLAYFALGGNDGGAGAVSLRCL